MHLSRRRFLQGSAAILGSAGLQGASAEGLLASIEKQVIKAPPLPKGTWFHPRVCMVGERALMTVQPIMGSDHFGQVHCSTSADSGQSWSEFEPVPPLGWLRDADGLNEGVCDVTPEYHSQTGSVLALGHNVFYRDRGFYRDQPARWPVYAVWKDGRWGPRRRLQWDDPRGSSIYSNNCGQRHVLPDGDVIMSFTFGVKDKPRFVCGVRCRFDGSELRVLETGNALGNSVGRGLLEPSVTSFGGRFYMTIRAEDQRGYVAVSDNGIHYEPQQPWTWDDGEPLITSTTQQHWLTHSDGLFLVYTRRDAQNEKVIRWRAPLWVAQVDPRTLRLVRSTERLLLPLIGDGVNSPELVPIMGNFGVCNASASESWVTDGSWCPKTNRGELQLARVRWSKPNGLRPT